MSKQSNHHARKRRGFVIGGLLSFSLTFAYLLSATFTVYQPFRLVPDWRGAKPITANVLSPLGYFRREFLLPYHPHKAYLVVSATDEVTVYVNANLVGNSRYFGAYVSEILDITQFLRPGNNLIAIAVANQATGKAVLTARVEVILPDGTKKTLLTDSQWRARSVEGYAKFQQLAWYALNFMDLDWAAANIVPIPDERPVYPPRVPEYVFQAFPEGHWIGHQKAGETNATFLREFHVNQERISGAWLGVSASGNYSITLNGLLLYAIAGSLRTMELYDIGPFVSPGSNRLVIRLESETILPKLAVSGLLTSAEERLSFNSDGRWQLLSHGAEQMLSAENDSIIVMDRLQEGSPEAKLALKPKEIEAPAELAWKRAQRFLFFTWLTFLATSLSLLLLHRINRFFDPVPLWQDLETLLLPLFLGAVLLFFMLLIGHDPRIGTATLEQPLTVALIVLLVLVWEALILIERIYRKGSADG
jgi:hypothetical protein